MVKIKEVTSVEEKAFNNLDKFWIVDEQGREGYTFMRAEEGAELDGFWHLDKRGQNQLKANKSSQSHTGGSMTNPHTQREFKADPAKQASIERSVALKEAVALYSGCVALNTGETDIDKISKDVLRIGKAFHVWLVNKPEDK